MSRARYDRLVEAGALGSVDRVELLDGLLVAREPQGDLHAAAVSAAHLALARAFGARHHVRVGAPVALDDTSEPEPDLAVVRGAPWDYRSGHPSKPLLVVEVSDSSLATDRLRKGPLYARAGVADYWIVNLVDRMLEVHREPVRSASGRWKYRSVRRLRPGATVAPLAAPRRRLRVADLLPQESSPARRGEVTPRRAR